MISKMMPVGLKQALNKVLQPSTGLQDPKTCKHKRKTGDEHGISCLDCGAALEGFGHMAKGSKTCIHKYIPAEENIEYCKYCEAVRPQAKLSVARKEKMNEK
jgi:hypothetical protein